MDDQTVIRPMPGGRKPRANQTPRQTPQSAAIPTPQRRAPEYRAPDPYREPAQPVDPVQPVSGISDENPLLKLITPLLSFLGKIQSTVDSPDLEEFHRYSLDQIQYYETQGWGITGGYQNREYISYPLCALIDEMVLNTPWGSNSRWGSESLLITRHQEAWGGERFFDYLHELMQRPGSNLELLEFYFTCLVLGFEGKYRRMNNGRRELDRLKSELYITISRHRDYEPERLSANWQGIEDRRSIIARYVPQWVIWCFALLLLTGGLLGFIWQITQQSDQVMEQMARIGNTPVVEVSPFNIDQLSMPPALVSEPDLVPELLDYFALLEPVLTEELSQGIVELIDEGNQVRVRLRHTRLFPSGQADLSSEFVPMMERVGAQLNGVGKPIIVEGHSDNIPIFSARYPSNWALSKARAKSVAEALLGQLEDGAIVRVEGKASSEPLVENSSNENRAINRRVEILLRK